MRPRFLRSILLCLAWLMSTVVALAQEVSVTARIGERTTEVNEPVQFEIEVSGATGNVDPPDVKVDGLEIQYAGPSSSRNIQIINGRMTSEIKTTFMYQIMPKREGDFTIPGQMLVVDGRPYKTQPIALKVQKGGDSGTEQGNGQRAFAEIVADKRTAYVGETFPVEVRFYVDRAVRMGEMNMPSLGEGSFTAQKFPQPQQTIENRNGRDYTVYIFRTAVAPTKTGKLTLGPTDITFLAQMPLPGGQARRQRRNSPFGMLDDLFNMRDSFGQVARYTVKAETLEIDVKTLPTEGRPKGFSGAIGHFEFEAEGSPSQVKLGEPVTMKLTVSGEGSFDRMKAPTMEDPTGWKAYDATEKFIAGNDQKNTGSKIFEIPVVPEEKQQWMPRYQFSYFDPVKEQYVTLRAKPEPLVVIGEPVVAPPPTPEVKSAPGAPPTPAPAAKATGLAGLSYEEGARGTFAPVHRRAGFWIANGAAGLVAFSLLAGRWLRRNPAAVRTATLRRERDELWAKVRAGGDDFYEHAVRLVQVQTALVRGGDAASVDAADARRAVKGDEELTAGIAAIFDERGERLYAGSGAVRAEVSAAERERVLKTLAQFCKS
jgi:hypothetical protein